MGPISFHFKDYSKSARWMILFWLVPCYHTPTLHKNAEKPTVIWFFTQIFIKSTVCYTWIQQSQADGLGDDDDTCYSVFSRDSDAKSAKTNDRQVLSNRHCPRLNCLFHQYIDPAHPRFMIILFCSCSDFLGLKNRREERINELQLNLLMMMMISR